MNKKELEQLKDEIEELENMERDEVLEHVLEGYKQVYDYFIKRSGRNV